MFAGTTCCWCDQPATKRIVLQKGRVGTDRGRSKPVMEKSVPACDGCARRLQRNNEGVEVK